MLDLTTNGDSTPGLDRAAQQDVVARGVGFLSVVGPMIVLALLPFYPPTRHFGSLGWVLVIPLSMLSIVGGIRYLTLKASPSMRAVYVSSFTGIAQLAFLQWLAGGGRAPYIQLILLPTLGAGTSQPARRCTFVALAAIAAAFSPGFYGHLDVGTTATEFTVVPIMAIMVSVVISQTRVHRAALLEAGDRASVLARIDPLTGLPNRRAFDEEFRRAVSSRRSGKCIALLLCDADSFKQINDTFGHHAGDLLLCSIARSLNDAIRKPDVTFRWAGDEFAVLLDDTDAEGAALVAARIRKGVEERCHRPDGVSVTLCMGMAQLLPGMADTELFMAADKALLRAKTQRQHELTRA
jgi:diguanylate cyclase (GGDEF)-like protein